MTLHSFWLAAAARPDALALVEPDGTEHTAGALLAQCNRTVSDRPFGLDDPLGRAVRDLFRSGRLPGVLLVDPRAVRRAPG